MFKGTLWILAFACLATVKASAFDNPPIRVRLQTSVEKIELEGIGVQIHGRQTVFEKVAIPRNQKIQIERKAGIWKVVRSQFGEAPHTEWIETPYLAMKAISLRQGGKSLPNQVFLAPQKQKNFDVVGVLPLESYLVGVIASEMPLSWPLETLKAQTVAARSYALVTMHERSKATFHVESTILDQVFSHIGTEDDGDPLTAKAKIAVKETEGLVLMAPNGKTLKAFYHSDCGGKTSNAKDIWGYGVSTGVAVDSSCPSGSAHMWQLKMTDEMLSEKISKYLKKDLGILIGMNLIRPSSEERIRKMELSFSGAGGGEKIKINANDFRAAIGFDQLKSTFFEVQKSGDLFQFSGKGFGHGVGLCQWGAKALGKQGKSFEVILEHYYPKALLQGLGTQKLQARTEPELATQIK